MLELVQNVPLFAIVGAMVCAFLCAVLPHTAARRLTVALTALELAAAVWLTCFLSGYGDSYIYRMGHFPAPWGNELRAGVLEALMSACFSAVMLLSILGGQHKVAQQVRRGKRNLYCVMLCLTQAALNALIYTNDLFTAYVFVEILTIAACALIMARQNGRTLVSAMRYMVLSLLGSGLLLISISLLYDLTGQLLMEPMHRSLASLVETGQYTLPITVVIGLSFVGLAIKSALFPFHTWLPDAYGYATPTSSAVLSSLISKGYLFLLIKLFIRVIGMDVIASSHATQLLLGFGVLAILMGSLSAIRAHDVRRMIAFSSVAQIGYIYAGLGLGTNLGIVAALFHMIAHSAGKSLLFLSASGLSDVSDDSKHYADLRGAGYRHPVAGAAFTVGSLSMTGVPLLGGFISKLLLAQSALDAGGAKLWILLSALVISTVLNAVYFLRTVITLYRPAQRPYGPAPAQPALQKAALCILSALSVALGVLATPVLSLISQGLSMLD